MIGGVLFMTWMGWVSFQDHALAGTVGGWICIGFAIFFVLGWYVGGEDRRIKKDIKDEEDVTEEYIIPPPEELHKRLMEGVEHINYRHQIKLFDLVEAELESSQYYPDHLENIVRKIYDAIYQFYLNEIPNKDEHPYAEIKDRYGLQIINAVVRKDPRKDDPVAALARKIFIERTKNAAKN